MLDLDYLDILEEKLKSTEDYYNYRVLMFRGERVLCCLNDFIFTTGLMIGLTEIGYYGRFCFDNKNKQKTIELFNSLQSIPDNIEDMPGNWIKYKGYGGELSNNKQDKNNCKNCSCNKNKCITKK